MRELKKVVIIGLGAIGSVYAAKLHDYNSQCLRVVVDETRYKRYIQEGLVFNGKRYDFNYVLPNKAAEKADVIIISARYG